MKYFMQICAQMCVWIIYIVPFIWGGVKK